MVIDQIRKMTVKGVKLKSESFFLMSPGVLELWRKNLRVAESAPLPAWIGLNEIISLEPQHTRLLFKKASVIAVAE